MKKYGKTIKEKLKYFFFLIIKEKILKSHTISFQKKVKPLSERSLFLQQQFSFILSCHQHFLTL